MKLHNIQVPRIHIGKFIDLVHRTDCRYDRNPYWLGDNLIVSLDFQTPESYDEFIGEWTRIRTPFVEVDGRGWFRRLKRRVRIWFRRIGEIFMEGV